MRISDNMRFLTMERSIADLRSRQAQAANRASTGRRVIAPSDDPVAAAELTRIQSRLDRTQDFRSTIQSVRSDASLSEATLAQASQFMVRAREIATQGANDTLNPADRAALAVEVSALKEQLLATANTRGTRGYLFSGTQTTTPTLSSTGSFQGDNQQHQVEIAPGVSSTVSVSGSLAFTAAGGVDAFATLDALAQALNADDGRAVAATLGNLEASRDQMVRQQGQAGMIMNRLDTADEALSVMDLELTKRQADLGAADPIETLTELSKLTQALEQAIGVARITLNTEVDRF
ncbi:MAG: flagellar hook-associated protein FlgL [Polyangiaceae bacterium]